MPTSIAMWMSPVRELAPRSLASIRMMLKNDGGSEPKTLSVVLNQSRLVHLATFTCRDHLSAWLRNGQLGYDGLHAAVCKAVHILPIRPHRVKRPPDIARQQLCRCMPGEPHIHLALCFFRACRA